MPHPLPSVPAGIAAEYPACSLIVRVESLADWPLLDGIAPERVAWVETSIELARFARGDVALDVVLSDPRAEAGRLYSIAWRRGSLRPPRVTIPLLPGAAEAGALAIALGLPVRLLAGQPGPDDLAALDRIFKRYLHDPVASQPVEFFHSTLAMLLHSGSANLWEVLERDPDLFPQIRSSGSPADPTRPPQTPGFVAAHLAQLTADGHECAECPFQQWCLGYFKWPVPGYDCAGIKRFLSGMVEVAGQLRADLSEMAALET